MSKPSPVIRPWEDEAQRLWEIEGETAAAIAKRYGVTKSTVIGLAHRRGWATKREPLGPEPRTLHDRMDALRDMMDALVAKSRSIPTIKPTGRL